MTRMNWDYRNKVQRSRPSVDMDEREYERRLKKLTKVFMDLDQPKDVRDEAREEYRRVQDDFETATRLRLGGSS